MRPNQSINATGPACHWCSCRPDDPLKLQPARQSIGIGCLGCLADLRAAGTRTRVLGKVVFTQEDRR